MCGMCREEWNTLEQLRESPEIQEEERNIWEDKGTGREWTMKETVGNEGTKPSNLKKYDAVFFLILVEKVWLIFIFLCS